MAETTYSFARAPLAALCDQVINDREALIIHRRGSDDVAVIPADELRSMEETLYLLSNPANARRLLDALERAQAGGTATTDITALRRELQLEAEPGRKTRGASRRIAS